MSTVLDRVRADFLMPSRLGDYEAMLERVLAAGYRVVSVETFWRELVASGVDARERRFVLRHDVDTDVATAAAMFAIDQRLGIASSYYFRLRTLDVDLMASIGRAGAEASYHYEELADVIKARRIRTREAATGHLPEARERFAANLTRLRSRTSLPLKVVASHGDFVNRRLGAPNWLILADRMFRRDVGIDLEAYDEDLLTAMPIRSADTAPPRCWVPSDPMVSVVGGAPVVYALVHPRHWRVARRENALDDLRRIREGVVHRWAPARAGGNTP